MLNSNSELRALTGLRGVAALTVALAHYQLPAFGAANRLFFWHNPAVDLFFCLSGFTLALVYVRKPIGRLGLWNYAVARLARIYPLYIASLLAMMLVRLPIGYAYGSAAGARDLVMQVLMFNSWPFGTGVHWNIPAWSVSVEWFCYLLIFPLLWLVGARIRPTVAVILAAISMVMSFVALSSFFESEDFCGGCLRRTKSSRLDNLCGRSHARNGGVRGRMGGVLNLRGRLPTEHRGGARDRCNRGSHTGLDSRIGVRNRQQYLRAIPVSGAHPRIGERKFGDCSPARIAGYAQTWSLVVFDLFAAHPDARVY